MRRKTQILGWTLIWSGLLIFGYLGWQLLGTDLINARVQAAAEVELDETLEQVREDLPVVQEIEVRETETETEVVVEYHPEEPAVENEELAYLRVPRLGLDVVVFEGVSPETLTQGPGHMPGTALPGQPGNAVISGHRTTYGRPFFDLDLLASGDRIEIETAIGLHIYEVRSSFLVQPTDVWVTDDRVGAWLTLTTCNPKFSARERLIITAEMVEGPNLDYVRVLEDRLDEVA